MRTHATTAKDDPPHIPGMVRVGVLRVSKAQVAIASAACVAAALATAAGSSALHATPDATPGVLSLAAGSLPLALVLTLVAVGLVHEASHALTARFAAGLPWRRISLVPSPLQLGVRCRIGGRVSVRHQRWIGVTPVLVTAVPLVLLSLLSGGELATLAALVALVYLPHDLAGLWQLHHFRGDDVVTGGAGGREDFVFRGGR